jgi:predicted N-acetyltransferase YhbS
LLAVHPEFQRFGAGRALVNWGVNAADEQGLKVIMSFSHPSSSAAFRFFI